MSDEGPRLDEALLAILRSPESEHTEALRRHLVELLKWLTGVTHERDRPARVDEAWQALDSLLKRAREPQAPEPVRAAVVAEVAEPEPQDAEDQVTTEDLDTGVRESRPPSADPFRDELESLWRELTSTEPAAAYTGYLGAGPAEDPIADLWKRIHLLLIRLPEEEAKAVRQQAREIAAAHVDLPVEYDPYLPVLPGYDGGGPELALEHRPGAADRLGDLLPIARRFAWLAANDPAVWIGDRRLMTSVMERADPQSAGIYRTTMGQQIDNILVHEPGSAQELDGLIWLDELIRGLVPRPLPHEDSWWSLILNDIRDSVLARHQMASRYSMSMRPGMAFSGVRKTLQEDKNIALAESGWVRDEAGLRGKVVWILRFPGRAPGISPGRVIYLPE
ncbi:hypothetical protein KZ829_15665 [Actinoplanes hulinensis]|uniref:Uncharacterized protein n=1 Tax=Actinoplanes hulinensis TaxID=1144547 RepID=A0ABS7B2U5_9ACTN|nr:hypothetical protein [Actinoplanes hulinensis]MBW6435177.1 hypothetical protein [Actinoplanes hulinensis]